MHLRFAIAAVALLALLASCARPSGRAVATVDGEAIGSEEFRSALAERSDDYGPDVLADSEGLMVVKKTVLNALIQETILLQTARAKSIALSPEEEQALDDESRDGYGPAELERILKERKISMSEWREHRRNKQLIDKLIGQEVYAPIVVTEKEIADYYKDNRAGFRLPDRIRCRHIVTNKKDKAERIRSLLDKGENFANIAQKYSESPDRENGGDLGFIARGQYPEIFERACFSLATGQTSDVVASEYGFHIFKVTDKQPSRQQPLKEVSEDIARRLREEKAAPALQAWMDALYSNKKITIDEKALKGVQP